MALGSETYSKVPRPVVPGDRIPLNIEATSGVTPTKVRVGPGLHQEGGELVAVKAGLLHHGAGNRWWVDNTQKRYVPAVGDSVLGTIAARHGESFSVDIGSAHRAILPILAFEGATKRNRPNLEVGTLIYARVNVANKDMDPELECIDLKTGRAGGYGEIKKGYVVRCSLRTARMLLDSKNPIFASLAGAFSFETAVGLNGRVWINAGKPAQIIAASRVIQAADGAAASDIERKVAQELRNFANSMDTS
ncbi:uncharacterized protein EV422DRAFT_514436 [Fimicolochytrium jonesii]|uniref:uncharacterized protein n=1 Tax=Fimicolochytrium jonesii TaxID=1396493 RepID=UPI0022FE79B5|nr:uncharacterized protein EV422DRAFT_514436 [Fimicolochytrium jonesii]KAI8825851.1 hypothetical protein EV422DRAFT_514436 [Fimicolochytrium jonesii]